MAGEETKLSKVAGSIRADIARVKEFGLEGMEEFRQKVSGDQSIKYAIEWGERVIGHEFNYVAAHRLERALENGADLRELLARTVEMASEQLLENRFTRSSTSAFHNAVEGAEAAATARFFRTASGWLGSYDREANAGCEAPDAPEELASGRES
jgi:CRISPR/Cas system-associated endonuclease Cas1